MINDFKNDNTHPESKTEKFSKQANHMSKALTQKCSSGGRGSGCTDDGKL